MQFNNNYMIEAINEAKKALEIQEVPIGAVIVYKSKIIAKAHNLVQSNRNPTLHAEMLSIIQATTFLDSKNLSECDLYVTLEPCPMCAYAISLARIKRLYFGALDPKGGGVENGPRIFSSSSCHHKPEIYGSIMEDDCSALMKKFFQQKRS